MTPMILVPAALLAATLVPGPRVLWDAWPERRFVAAPAGCLRPDDLAAALRALAAKHPGRVRLEEAGRSVEGRPIHLVAVGTGPRRVLLWSQMHGDEPSATPALLDVADYLLTAPEERFVLDQLTLLMVPMLNPDGTERVARRNAQGIDINRDALNLATPEGRLLKEIRDRHQPVLGFNLHDQDRRTAVGDTGRLATIALLAVAGDPQGTMTEGRMRAKRASSAIVAALRPLRRRVHRALRRGLEPAGLRRQHHRLGHAGGAHRERGLRRPAQRPHAPQLRRPRLRPRGARRRRSRPPRPRGVRGARAQPRGCLRRRVARGGRILQGAGEPYRADIAFDVQRPDRRAWGCPGAPDAGASRIAEVGDTRFVAAGREVDAAGALLVPALVASVRGLAARRWLTAAVLDESARLGVGELRWHVGPGGHGRRRSPSSPGAPRPAGRRCASWRPPLLRRFLVMARAPGRRRRARWPTPGCAGPCAPPVRPMWSLLPA